MRKITENKKTNKKRNNLILAVFLIFIMTFGLLGYAFQGTPTDDKNKVKYNGFEFIKNNNFWIVQIGDLQFAFINNPQEIEKTEGNLKSLDNYYQKPLYLSSEEELAENEIARNLNYFVQRIQKACLKGEACEGDLPIKTCEDNFIIIRQNEEPKIKQEQNCVFIEGKKEELTGLVDDFLFSVLGIY